MKIEIGNTADRREVAGILVANGYTVRETKIKDGKRNRTVLEAVKDGECENEREIL